ncbi:MAG: hypothetical protein ABSF26_23580 [Thermoguttaceae bacterium]|jgi:hypothetical protein
MAEQAPKDKIPLTIYLSAGVAKRLSMAAEAQRRAAADLVADLLERHLPRPPSGEAKKGTIPYA